MPHRLTDAGLPVAAAALATMPPELGELLLSDRLEGALVGLLTALTALVIQHTLRVRDARVRARDAVPVDRPSEA